ncbi:hypothetical protein SG34_028090 [Thalassomonas viridans]|uniref:DnrO protein n=1 Tax=Thalassomonas viridans TaxID=137584 RepID=A0AAF0C9R5_9GAMM|nr:hypothetical protein [Thalassomonas viridans]WDE05114.1 hypothetical protein SG34_028090 [Thalassomonas viridans]
MIKLTLLSVLLLLVTPVMAEEHVHHHGESAMSLSLNQGEKWPVDDGLHTGMSGIKILMSAAIGEIHHNTFTAEKYLNLAGELQGQLEFIFKNCKLPPAADAQLHILLADMLQGVEQMKGREEQRQGAIKIMKALHAYPEYFADGKWQ